MSDDHKFHRQRMRERYKKEGVSTFFDHELLEMLLFYVYRQGNTNEYAHRLLSEFNGISGVMRADPAALTSIKGIGPECTMLLNIVGELFRRGMLKGDEPKKPCIKSLQNAVDYCRNLFLDKKYECLYAICLDPKGYVISDGFISEGVIDRVPAYARKVVETALRHTAHMVIIAHNHPANDPSPSPEDDEVTANFKNALNSIGIALNDHIIISKDKYFSYSKAGKLKMSVDYDDARINELVAAARKNHLLKGKYEEYVYKTIE